MSTGSANGRLVAVFMIGCLTGLGVACGISYLFEVKFKRSEAGVHKLTSDLNSEELYAFRGSPGGPPLLGVIKAGSEYQVQMRKGQLSYISFRTVIPTGQLQSVSGPLVESHVVSPGAGPAASSTFRIAAGLPNNALQRTRYARR